MLKSCKYCGKIHDSKYDCGKKPKKKKRYSNQISFRNTAEWKRKAKEIKERDVYQCRICMANGVINAKELEVHHIEPLEECYDKRLDDDNLITLCRYHHEKCESGAIEREYQHMLAKKEKIILPPVF
ncbi:MAG: HNH endonuclease [Lachnospiraceae bacterium]